jgi:4-amino-4-deoxy-L-arabinose transferase-like glycosyltransferase
MDAMTVFVLIAAAMAAASLTQGIVSMAHGGESDQRRSAWLMLRRVGWQAAALGFILLALLAGH